MERFEPGVAETEAVTFFKEPSGQHGEEGL